MAGRTEREQVTMRRIAGASYCPLPLSQAVLVERVNTKSTRRGIFRGRELAISTEIRRRSRLCRWRGAAHACSRARIASTGTRRARKTAACFAVTSQKGIVHLRLKQRLLFRLCHTGTAENRYAPCIMISAHCYALSGIVFFLQCPTGPTLVEGTNEPTNLVCERARRPCGRHLLALFFLPHPPHPSALTEAASTVVHVVFI